MMYPELPHRTKMSLLVRTALLFKRAHFAKDTGPWLDVTVIRYKTLRGVMYILNAYHQPPLHANCRCVMILPEERTDADN